MLIAQIIFFAVVARRRFRTEQEHARYAVRLRVLTNFFVLRKNVQQVQVLTFVLVQTLDLDIENRLRVDLDTGTPLHKLRQTNLVGQLNVAIRLTELRVIGIFFEVDQLVEIVGPLFLQRFIQQRGQSRVALFDPAARVMPLVTLWNLFGHSW